MENTGQKELKTGSYRLAIVGSRGIAQIDVEAHLSELPTLVVSGGARGVDSLGEQWARRRGIKTLIIKPEWDKYGKSAGFRRNYTIVDNADRVLAFWDGTSRGTAHTVEYARKMKKPVTVVTIKPIPLTNLTLAQ